MMALPLETWVRFIFWSIIGLVIYFAFGKRNSALAGAPPDAGAA
jgi:APA family basic amino acid/polyamine antiporter